jgi:hypothetical protein
VNDRLVSFWEEIVVAYFKTPQRSSEETGKSTMTFSKYNSSNVGNGTRNFSDNCQSHYHFTRSINVFC